MNVSSLRMYHVAKTDGAMDLTKTPSIQMMFLSVMVLLATLANGVVHAAPQADDDFGTAESGQALEIDVLANDTAESPDVIDMSTIFIMANPGNGSVEVDMFAGTVTYTSTMGFSGYDNFTYTVLDTAGVESNTATVDIYVNAAVPPTAEDDTVITDYISIVVCDVLQNDTSFWQNINLNLASVTVDSGPSNGQAVVDQVTGAITYTPDPGFGGDWDSFTYTVDDELGATSNTATVDIFVNPPEAPLAQNDTSFADANTPNVIAVLNNDASTAAGVSLLTASIAITAHPTSGSVSVNPVTGEITYTPAEGFDGEDQFSYTVDDEFGTTSNSAQVTVYVDPDDAPIIDSFTATKLQGDLWMFNGNVTDEDPLSLTFTWGGVLEGHPQPQVLRNDGHFRYTVELSSEETGLVSVIATDALGNESEIRFSYVD